MATDLPSNAVQRALKPYRLSVNLTTPEPLLSSPFMKWAEGGFFMNTCKRCGKSPQGYMGLQSSGYCMNCHIYVKNTQKGGREVSPWHLALGIGGGGILLLIIFVSCTSCVL